MPRKPQYAVSAGSRKGRGGMLYFGKRGRSRRTLLDFFKLSPTGKTVWRENPKSGDFFAQGLNIRRKK